MTVLSIHVIKAKHNIKSRNTVKQILDTLCWVRMTQKTFPVDSVIQLDSNTVISADLICCAP